MRRQQLTASIFGLIIFAMGIMVGVLSQRFYNANGVNASEDWRARYVKEMHTRLKLSPVQLDKLNDILDDTRMQVRAAREKTKPEIQAIKQLQIEQIKAMLKPQQYSEYDKMVAEQERRAKDQDVRDKQLDEQRAAERLKRQQHPATN
jgi:hypothetical protein